MNKAASSESIGNQMSETVVPSSHQIVESVIILVDSEIVVHLVIRLRSLPSLDHNSNINMRLLMEMVVQSHGQMRRTECSERWV